GPPARTGRALRPRPAKYQSVPRQGAGLARRRVAGALGRDDDGPTVGAGCDVVTAEQVRVRPCEARDLDHFAVFGSELHVQYCRDEFAQTERIVVLVAVSEDEPLGKIHVHLDHGNGTVWLEAAAVARPMQGQGIGTRLVGAAEAL